MWVNFPFFLVAPQGKYRANPHTACVPPMVGAKLESCAISRHQYVDPMRLCAPPRLAYHTGPL